MISHGQILPRTVPTGDGQENEQKRFYCSVHGFFDLFVHKNVPDRHALCKQTDEADGVGIELPEAVAKAA